MNKTVNINNNTQKERLYTIELTLKQAIDLGTLLGDEGARRVETLELAKEKGLDLDGSFKGYHDRDVREIKLAKDVIKILIKATGEQIISEPALEYLEK